MILVAHTLFMMSESSSELCFDAVIAIYSDFRASMNYLRTFRTQMALSTS